MYCSDAGDKLTDMHVTKQARSHAAGVGLQINLYNIIYNYIGRGQTS